MKILLDGLLPRVFPGLAFLCVSHEGKQDLEKSIVRKLKAWREPGVRFVIVCDNDGGDCRLTKQQLSRLCEEAERPDSIVQIVCQELEAWYFGSPTALAQAFEREDLTTIGAKARFRDPDRIQQPSKALAELIPEFQKVGGARRMAKHLTKDNRSGSFRILLSGIGRIIG